MQKRSLAVMAVVFAGLLAYVLFVEVGREEQRQDRQDLEKQVLPTDVESMRRVRVERSSGAVEIVYRGEGVDGEWHLVDPFEAPADPAAAKALARAAATLSRQRTLETASENTAQYGLDEPTLVVTLGAEGLESEAVLRFGGETGSKDGRYLSLEDAVLIVPSHEFRALDKGVDDLRDRRLVRFSPGAAVQVRIRGEGGPVDLVREDGHWWIQGEPRYRAERMDVEDFLADLTTSRVLGFLDADDPSLGLEGSGRSVEIDLQGGERIAVTFGGASGSGIVAQLQGQLEAAEVSRALVEPVDRPPDLWRTLEVADINPWQTESCRFEFGGRQFDLVSDEDGDWTLTEGDGQSREITGDRAREILTQIDHLDGTSFLLGEVGPEVGWFEISGEGQAVVRFTLHRHADEWAATVAGDPAPLQVPDTLGLFMEEFLADPLGEDG